MARVCPADGTRSGNPLAHTLWSRKLHEVRLDGEPVSEYRLHALAAATVGVPVVLVTGDEALCQEVAKWSPGTTTYAVKRGEGASTQSRHPLDALDGIRAAAESALRSPPPPLPAAPSPCRLEVAYKDQALAFARSWYPGAELVDDHTVALGATSYFDVLRALVFLV